MPFTEQSSVLNAASSSAQDIASAKFLIGIMCTPGYLAKAARLLASCKAHGLAAVLYEVPAVHTSISITGSDDLSYTKPAFIRFLLDKYRKPVLYLNAGCIIAQSPARIFALVEERADFAIYNWLADEHTEGYAPVSVQVQEGWSTVLSTERYYRYRPGVDYYDPAQLICGVGVQFWNDTPSARELLNGWQRMIERDPKCLDAHCLDFVFNYRGTALARLKTAWLDKSYLRMSWWIYVKPVIDYVGAAASDEAHESLEQREGVPRVVQRQLKRPPVAPVFPKDCLVDSVEQVLVRPTLQNSFETVGPLPAPIWITRY